MNRIVLATVLAGTTALLGACGGGTTNTVPNKPDNKPATPVTVTPASPMQPPVASPSLDPKASPAKPGASPEVKKDEKKAGDPVVKPTVAASPKKP